MALCSVSSVTSSEAPTGEAVPTYRLPKLWLSGVILSMQVSTWVWAVSLIRLSAPGPGTWHLFTPLCLEQCLAPSRCSVNTGRKEERKERGRERREGAGGEQEGRKGLCGHGGWGPSPGQGPWALSVWRSRGRARGRPAGGGASSAARRRRRSGESPPPAGSLPSPAPFSALSLALPSALPLSRPRSRSPAPPRRRPSATMAHRGSPRAPKGPGLAAGAPSPGAPPPPRSPRSRPLLLLLLLLLAACGAAGRSPEPGRLGPRVRLVRAMPSPPAGRALPGRGEDGQARGAEPGAPAPGPAPGPGENGAPAAGQRRWARAAPVAGAASRAQVSLISTSFVLKGDATHNQAMVHWTGENSSVSDLRAPPAAPGPDSWEPPHFWTSPGSPRAFSATWGRESSRRRPCWPLTTVYLGRGPWICERTASHRRTFPPISGTLSHLRGAPTGLQIPGYGLGDLQRLWNPGHFRAPPGPLGSPPTRCCALIAFRLHPVRSAWEFGSRTPSTLVCPGPSSWQVRV